jgi:DNA-directed RNA polymerase specialized sigma24 family protein
LQWAGAQKKWAGAVSPALPVAIPSVKGTAMSTVSTSVSVEQTLFLERVRPMVEKHARYSFRGLSRGACEEMVSECVAVAWAAFVRLVDRGKNPADFASTIGRYAVRHVKSGRYVDGVESGKDVLSPRARKRHGIKVERLTRGVTSDGDGWQEAVRDNSQTAPPDAAAFRIDFPRWLSSLGERHRRIVEHLAVGFQPKETARMFGVSAGRICQLRWNYFRSWQCFHGEPA